MTDYERIDQAISYLQEYFSRQIGWMQKQSKCM